MRLLRFAVVASAALVSVAAIGAYRRSAAEGVSFGTALREVAGDWSCQALRERARVAALNGLRAAELRAEAADRELIDPALTR